MPRVQHSKANPNPHLAAAKHDLETYLNLLGVDGKYVIVGAPAEPFAFNSFSIIASECPVGRGSAGLGVGWVGRAVGNVLKLKKASSSEVCVGARGQPWQRSAGSAICEHTSPVQIESRCSLQAAQPCAPNIDSSECLMPLCPAERITIGGSLIGGIKETQEMLGEEGCCVLASSYCMLLVCRVPSVAWFKQVFRLLGWSAPSACCLPCG